MALWDMKAKLVGEPLWRLLGGRDRLVPGYASGLDFGLDDDELHAFYADAAARGFRAGKLKGGDSVDDDVRRLRIIDEALRTERGEPALMLHANETWSLKEAVRFVSRVEDEVDLWWIEEPLRRGTFRVTRDSVRLCAPPSPLART